MHPQPIGPVPEDAARVARAAFPKGNVYMQIRDVLGTIFFEVDDWMLLVYLEDSDYLCLMVDGRMKLRQEFVEEADWKSLKSNRRARALRSGRQLSD